jgi:copper resistance protein C
MRLALLLLPLLLLAGRAEAHAVLIESNPAASATVGPGSLPITLRYNSKIDRGRSRVTLTAPGAASPAVLKIGSDGPPDIIHTSTDAKPGDYVLHWQVLATDGHITRGDVPFSVK